MREQGILINAGDMSGNITSNGLQFDNVTRMSLHLVITGAPTGVVTIQCSNDLVGDHSQASIVNWVDYTGGTSAVSGATQIMFNIKDVSFKWIRLVYVFGSGTGTLNANFYSVTDK